MKTKGLISGKECPIVLDTGATKSAVPGRLVQQSQYMGGRVKVTFADMSESINSSSHIYKAEWPIMRWALALQTYDFEIVHRPGISHQNADGLSRQDWDLPEIPRQTLADLPLARVGGRCWSPRSPTLSSAAN